MSTRRSLVIAGLITLASLIYSALMFNKLGEVVPTHWNAAGEVDQYGSKWVPLLMPPGVMVLMALLMVGLPAISPKKFEIDTFRGTFNYVMIVVLCMFAVMHVVIMQATIDGSFPIGRVLPAVIFLFFAALGNVLGKVRRNFWMGIRTPWTLADEGVWERTHRSAARIWTVGGLLGFLFALFGLPFWAVFGLLIVMALVPVLQSFLFYKQMDRSGRLAS